MGKFAPAKPDERATDHDIVATFRRLRSSLANSAGTVVFGMEDGTVSIFGLIFGVAATTTSSATVLIAGASGAVAAAVSMMAGAYLEVETTRDAIKARRSLLQSDRALDEFSASLPNRFKTAGLTREQSAALDRRRAGRPRGARRFDVGAAKSGGNAAQSVGAGAMDAAGRLSGGGGADPAVRVPADPAGENHFRHRNNGAADRARHWTCPYRRTQHTAYRAGNGLHRHCRRAGGRCYWRSDQLATLSV